VNFKFTLALLVVAIVAVVGFGVAQKRTTGDSSPDAAGTPTPVLTDLTPSDVNSVDVKAGGKETTLAKDGGSWKLVKPVEDANVNQAKVNQVVSQVATLSGSRSVAAANADVTPYGLRNPQLTVALAGSSGKKETLLVGDKTVNGNQYYAVRQEGSEVGLISSALVTSLLDLVNNPPQASASPAAVPSA
jgi:hypothetical protein